MARDPYRYFRVEARELIEGLTQGVLELEKGSTAPDLVRRLLRLAHTLKGAARVVKQSSIADLAHTAEGLLTSHRDGAATLSGERASELYDCSTRSPCCFSRSLPRVLVAPPSARRMPRLRGRSKR